MDFKFFFSRFLRRLHWFLLFLIIGSAIGITLATVLPPVYMAKARLLVESEQIPEALAASTVQTGDREQLQIIQQRILTREKLVDLANQFGIYDTEDGPGRLRMNTDTLVEDLRSRIGIITTGSSDNATLVSVSFRGPTATMAATVTNELVTLILREDVEMRTSVARGTLKFFEQDVARLEQELADLEAKILEFKEANKQALPDSLEFRRNQQVANQERVVQLERQIAATQDNRDRLERLYSALGPDAPLTGVALTPEAQQLKALEDQLASDRAILSDTNPKVVLLRSRIAELRQRVNAQNSIASDAGGDGVTLTEYEIQLAQIDGQLDYLKEQRDTIYEQLGELEASIDATSSNAITLSSLERDYDNIRMQYNQAVANKARAETGDIIEALQQGQRISVIEQATVPASPTKPNRKAIAAGGVFAGALGGLAMVFLLEFLNKGIRRPADLTNALGITPFATLPYFRTRADTIKRRMLILGILSTFLVGIPLGLWLVDSYVIPLETLIGKVGSAFGLDVPVGRASNA